MAVDNEIQSRQTGLSGKRRTETIIENYYRLNIMKIFAKIFLAFLILVIGLWQIPWLIAYFDTDQEDHPFTLYSCVTGDFAMIEHGGEDLTYTDRKGNIYTESQFDSILPLFYARQLYSEGRFPDTLASKAVSLKEALEKNFFFNSHPSDINRKTAGIHFLLESESGRVDLEMPNDAFRITGRGIEFIEMESNSLDTSKSRIFTEAMKECGFAFPAKCVSGNPSTRKEYDEGYILTDHEGSLFHLKMVKGRPYIKKIDLPGNVRAEQAFITEFQNRSLIALFTDSEETLYAVRMPGYETMEIGIQGKGFDPRRESILIVGNMFDWTIRISSDERLSYYAVSSDDLSLLDMMECAVKKSRLHGLHFSSAEDKFVKPRFY